MLGAGLSPAMNLEKTRKAERKVPSWESVYNGSSQPGCGRGSLGMENTAQERVRKRAWQNRGSYDPWKGITEKPRLQCIELGKEDKL